MSRPRYAIYFSPAHRSALERLASQWLCRDAYTGEYLPPRGFGGIDAENQAAITGEPRRYGFHATLKPPFALHEGRSLAELLEGAEAFAAGRSPVRLAGLRVAPLGRFVALVPLEPDHALEALAADCVRDFDRFRAPPEEAELERRRAKGLTGRQDELLRTWGYPYVMDEFRFHMTLTDSLPQHLRDCVLPALAEAFDPVCSSPFILDAISVFEQADRGDEFRVLRRFEFLPGNLVSSSLTTI